MQKISIVGTRGIPARYGGFETFAEEFSQLLVRAGYQVSVQCDPSENRPAMRNGVDLFYSPVSKTSHPLLYYYYGLRHSLGNSEIIIITGSAGALFYFLNIGRRRILITNTDGVESRRTKWSFLKRTFLKITEMLSMKMSDIIIADSLAIESYLKTTYGIFKPQIRVIEYGANINAHYEESDLSRYRLNYRGYYLVVCRLEPENNVRMIIEGYLKSGSDLPLVIIGNLSMTRYIRSLRSSGRSDKVLFIGGIYNKEELNSLRYGCKAYLHGHSVGGTNPSLLEAMANGNIIICHDNQFNREVTGDSQFYFSDAEECSLSIRKAELLSATEIESYRNNSLRRINDLYNWDSVLRKYINLFSSF